MIASLIVSGIMFVEKIAEAHFANHGTKVPGPTKQGLAVAVIGDAINLLSKIETALVLPPNIKTALALPSNIKELIDLAVAIMNEFQSLEAK